MPLPSFAPYDTSALAGGFISGRFLTGIRPQVCTREQVRSRGCCEDQRLIMRARLASLRRVPLHAGVLLPLHGWPRGPRRHGREDISLGLPAALPDQGAIQEPWAAERSRGWTTQARALMVSPIEAGWRTWVLHAPAASGRPARAIRPHGPGHGRRRRTGVFFWGGGMPLERRLGPRA